MMVRSATAQTVCLWRQRLARFQNGGLTISRFCEEEGVSTVSFYRWRKKLQQPLRPPSDSPADFVPVHLTTAQEVQVQLPGGALLKLPAGDRQALRVVLQTLAELDRQPEQGE